MWRLDPGSPHPPFEQIKAQISEGRATGALAAGFRLPPVRRLAEELGLAANTVARAYRELESEGVIETRGRAGSFVTGESVALNALDTAAALFWAQAQELGFDLSAAGEALRRAGKA